MILSIARCVEGEKDGGRSSWGRVQPTFLKERFMIRKSGIEMNWDVYKVYYMTYEEIESQGDTLRKRVASNLSFEQAKKMVDFLGFGHSMHPSS